MSAFLPITSAFERSPEPRPIYAQARRTTSIRSARDVETETVVAISFTTHTFVA
jgi:hypothetical protein